MNWILKDGPAAYMALKVQLFTFMYVTNTKSPAIYLYVSILFPQPEYKPSRTDNLLCAFISSEPTT